MGCLLIVDDEVLAVEGLKRALRGKVPGISDILVAHDLTQARNHLAGGQVSVVITDVEMAGENGLDLLVDLPQISPETKPIVLSCHPNFPYVQQALRLHSVDYLLKPIPAPELIQAIQRAMGREALVPDHPLCSVGPTPNDCVGTADLPRWELMLKAGSYDQVRFEVLSHIKRQSTTHQRDASFIKPLALDLQQLFFSYLQSKGIPAHQLLGEMSSEILTEPTPQNADDLVRWSDQMLSRVERTSLDRDQKETPFGRACEFISRHVAENLYCEEIADHVSVNSDYLSHVFKKKTGLSVNQYIIREKMKTAAGLLATTQVPVCHIASGLGYANFSHFSQSFKKIYDVCPNDYRGNHQFSPAAVTEN